MDYRYVYAKYYTGVHARNIIALAWWRGSVQKKPKIFRKFSEIAPPPLILKSFSFWAPFRRFYI